MSLRSWYAWHDSLMCDTCLIGTCDMAHAYMWHETSARHYFVQRCQRSIFQKGGREKKPRGSGVLVVGIISAHDALLLNSRIHISYYFFKFWAAYFPAFFLDVPKIVRFLTWLFWKRDLIIWGSFARPDCFRCILDYFKCILDTSEHMANEWVMGHKLMRLWVRSHSQIGPTRVVMAHRRTKVSFCTYMQSTHHALMPTPLYARTHSRLWM